MCGNTLLLYVKTVKVNSKPTAVTFGSLDVSTRPAGERDVDDQEGEANERHEVIKLVRTVHGDAENDDQDVEAE